MRKLGLAFATLMVGLGLGAAVVGCGTSNATPKDKMMTSDKMSGDKMHSDKMATDKMSTDKMGTDKMAGEKKDKMQP